MKKKMLAAVLAGTMVMSLGTILCWAEWREDQGHYDCMEW